MLPEHREVTNMAMRHQVGNDELAVREKDADEGEDGFHRRRRENHPGRHPAMAASEAGVESRAAGEQK